MRGMIKGRHWNLLTAPLMLALAAAVLLLPRLAGAVGLKESGFITEDVIKLSDIFHGLPEDREKVLGPAPMPGEDMTLNARTLLRIAIALDLPWRPQTAAQSITLTRVATVISKSDIEDGLRQAISAKGIAGKFTLQLPATLTRIVLPQAQPATFDLSDLTIDVKNRSFHGMIMAPSAEAPLQKVPVSGSFERLVDVPVLRGPLNTGGIINERDLDSMEMRERDVQGDIIMTKDNLLGLTPRRLILAGTPIRSHDVETPQIVGRGDLITLIFKSNNLTLTARGKALESGAQGDLIRIVNTGSNKTIQGRVTASKEVTVSEF